MTHHSNGANSVAETVLVDFQDHDRMIISLFLELSISTTQLSDTFNVLVIIIAFTWEPDYASRRQVSCVNAWP
jgi:hypothetical protein